MKTGDNVTLYNDPYGYLGKLGLSGSVGYKGVIQGPAAGDWSGYGIPYGLAVWLVRLNGSTYSIAEASLTLDPQTTTTKEGNMLIAITILKTKKDTPQEILVPTTELVAQDQNTALLLLGAQRGKDITDAVAEGSKLQVVARTLAPT
jgi:hypothetical protein